MSSRTPSDDFTPDLGSSFLLEDFDFSEDYNEGVLEGARLPESRGLAELPEGLVKAEGSDLPVPEGVMLDEAEGFDLGVLGLVATSSLPQSEHSEDVEAVANTALDFMDFSWLSDATQDPTRLPSLDTNKVIPELERAWGTRTDGVHRIEAVDRNEALYRQSVENDEVKLKFSNEELRSVLASAMRRSAMGIPLAQIKREIVQLLGHEASRLAKPLKALEAEHGLVGNVYIRASAYPGLLHGKWAKHIRTKHKHARYLIACGTCDACQCEDHESCACNANLGLEAVEEVDWKEAYQHYAKRLKATGRLAPEESINTSRRVTAAQAAKSALQQAFLRREVSPSRSIETSFPTHVPPADTVSRREAREALALLDPVEREVLTNDDISLSAKRKVLKTRLGHLVQADLLTSEEARRLLASKEHPSVVVKKANRIITARHKEGQYQGDGRMLELASDSEAAEALAAHSTEHQARLRAQKTSSVNGESIRQVEKMVRWTRQQMTEGLVGKDLTTLMRARWSGSLIRQATAQLVQIRKKHEGLSGHLYVDAGAYASPKGTTGCEKAAPKHRANALKAVLAMPRCASCTARSRREDGIQVCQKYGKMLVASPPVKDPKRYQAEQIRLANASDAEVTASLFSNPAAEFGLHNDVLDSFNVEETPETIDGFSFSGMEWGNE